MRHYWTALVVAVASLLEPVYAAVDPGQVLVVYNSQVVQSRRVFDHYVLRRPGVLGLDLNDATLAAGNISYPDFVDKIRDPIRSHLQSNDLTEQVVVFTMTKGLPHRITDTTTSNIGDRVSGNPPPAFQEMFDGDANFASVDSELTLLWQDLDAGEAGGRMDSKSDNYILNPYFGSSAGIDTFSRADITDRQRFRQDLTRSDPIPDIPFWRSNNGSEGDFYLVTRLDGDNVPQVRAMIDRAQNPVCHLSRDAVVFDESEDNFDGDDYENAAAALRLDGWLNVQQDATSAFLTGLNGTVSDPNALVTVDDPVAALITYGGNHSFSSQNGYIDTFAGQLIDGALLISLESFNGRQFGGLPQFDDQGTLAEWIAAGGTFSVGYVWEPTILAMHSTEHMVQFFTEDLTFAEAAYSGIPFLSWQHVVVGDPLATVTTLIPEPSTLSALVMFLLCRPVLSRPISAAGPARKWRVSSSCTH